MTVNVYADELRRMSTLKRTENGAVAYNTTGFPTLDLFATIGGMRYGDGSMERLSRMIDAACSEDPLATARMLFYARDVRGGLGEREVFRKALFLCAKSHPEIIVPNLRLIPEYGRWDDLLSLIGTPLEGSMWDLIKEQLARDSEAVEKGEGGVSLLAKWMPSADTSSKDTRKVAFYCADSLGMSVYSYKRYIRAIRRHLDLLETKMSAGKWSEIDYETVPSQAHMRHIAAFKRNDAERYLDYLSRVESGEAGMRTGTLYPYEIIERLDNMVVTGQYDQALELMWRNLPDYVGNGGNVMIIADTSGSMEGRPIAVAVSLALYFAERNSGPFGGMYMTFSGHPRMIAIDPNQSLAQRLADVENGPWGQNTDLNAALSLMLDTAIRTQASQEDMPRSLVIITDMEIDQCQYGGAEEWSTLVDIIDQRYRDSGYRMPNLVFWNVASRHDTFLAMGGYMGVQMVSGSSAAVFEKVMGFLDCMTPREAMMQVLGAERYSQIRVDGRPSIEGETDKGAC